MVVDRLRKALGDKVSTDAALLMARRHDSWVLSLLEDVEKRASPLPQCVVRPASVDDVVTVVNACRETATPLVPFGLGSGVCGGVRSPDGAVVLDMGAMNRIRSIDADNLLASFDAGVRGSDAEDALAERKLTLGHYPQSIGISSVGGWVATRAAGQFSTAYGNVEDVIFSLEAVLPSGERVETRGTPRASAGPDLRHFFLGSEGTLGVVTGVTYSIRRAPEVRTPSAYHVATMHDGFELQRELVQSGFQPAVLRLYDADESSRMFSKFARDGSALLLVISEGPGARVAAETAAIQAIAERRGAATASSEAAERWLRDRNHVPTLTSFLEGGMVVDTIEIAATWSRIDDIYQRAVAALRDVPGMMAGSAHSSHVYRSGINLYFTFAARPERREDLAATYLASWRAVMDATLAGGGGIAHHHGIGRMRKALLGKEVGEGGLSALRALKRALDPVGFMNPGVLFPDE
jgi:alkyldihydroxyacetonephosphate synthase